VYFNLLVTSVYHSIDILKEGRTASVQLYIFTETRTFLVIYFHAIDILVTHNGGIKLKYNVYK
jgi:hypothetical protein